MRISYGSVGRGLSILAALLTVAIVEETAHAQLTWSTASLGTSNTPSPPATDLGLNTTSPSVYVMQGTVLYAFNATTAGAGAKRWSVDYGPAKFGGFPTPVPLKNGTNAVFFAGDDGKVYAVRASDGTKLWSTLSVALPNSPCTGNAITSSPAIQLWKYSNAAFQSSVSDDLVFISTRYGCTTTGNRVYALYASTGAVAWSFNSSPQANLDYGSDSCALDYDNNEIYCGFNQPSSQPTLLGLDTRTGAKKFAVNAGPIRTRPTLRGGKIYVTTVDGWLRARNPANGAEYWSQKVTTNSLKSPYVEQSASLNQTGSIVVMDTVGGIYVYNDSRGAGTPTWSSPNYGATTLAAAASYSQRLYVGKNDGTLHELGYQTGLEKQSLRIGSATGTVFDPSMTNEANSNPNGNDGDRVFAVSVGALGTAATLGLFTAPWNPITACTLVGGVSNCDGVTSLGGSGTFKPHICTSNAGCHADPCATYTCDLGSCEPVTTCSGECCKTPWACVDPSSDSSNCGGCGIDCPAGNGCVAGNCTPCSASCTGATPLCASNLTTCQCDQATNSCSSLGSQYSCGTNGACSCAPVCPQSCFEASMGDGCGGQCTPTCSGGQNHCVSGLCQCVPSCPAGCFETVQPDGCGGTCAPSCTGGQNHCVSGSCQCVPNCSTNSSVMCVSSSHPIADGCGGSCASNCSGFRRFCCSDPDVFCGTSYPGNFRLGIPPGDNCPSSAPP